MKTLFRRSLVLSTSTLYCLTYSSPSPPTSSSPSPSSPRPFFLSSTSSPFSRPTFSLCEEEQKAKAGEEELDESAPGTRENLPIYRQKEISKHKTKDLGIWVTYREGVYDITKFVQNHPGGSDKILLAAGKSVEPFWRIYRQHYNSKMPLEFLGPMRVGTLHADDVASQAKTNDSSDPYNDDPVTSPVMIIHSEKPVNAGWLG